MRTHTHMEHMTHTHTKNHTHGPHDTQITGQRAVEDTGCSLTEIDTDGLRLRSVWLRCLCRALLVAVECLHLVKQELGEMEACVTL